MAEHGDRCLGCDRHVSQCDLWMRDNDLISQRESRAAGESTARVNDNDAVAQHLGQRCERHSNVYSTDDDQPWRRGDHLDKCVY